MVSVAAEGAEFAGERWSDPELSRIKYAKYIKKGAASGSPFTAWIRSQNPGINEYPIEMVKRDTFTLLNSKLLCTT